jgi:hypothetical protein
MRFPAPLLLALLLTLGAAPAHAWDTNTVAMYTANGGMRFDALVAARLPVTDAAQAFVLVQLRCEIGKGCQGQLWRLAPAGPSRATLLVDDSRPLTARAASLTSNPNGVLVRGLAPALAPGITDLEITTAYAGHERHPALGSDTDVYWVTNARQNGMPLDLLDVPVRNTFDLKKWAVPLRR